MKIIKKGPENAEKFTVATVAQAIGRSEGSITAVFSTKGISTKGGITIDQIEEAINYPSRGNVIDWKAVRRIRQMLSNRGYVIDFSDEKEEE